MTPYAGIICSSCGKVDLSWEEYEKQMDKPDSLWECPACRFPAEFDDARFEELNPEVNE